MAARGTKIAVIGAAGRTGRQLLRALAKRRAHVRSIVRSAERAKGLEGSFNPVVADLASVEALSAAFRDMDTVHFIPPLFNPLEEAYAANAIQAATNCGVRRFIYHSVLHADTPQMPHHVRKARIERAIRDSELCWTIVQPAMYVTTPLLYLDRNRAVFQPPFSVKRRFNPIDTTDLSEAVANVLCQKGHEFVTYELAGSDGLDFEEMAGIASRVLGTTVRAEAVDPDIALSGRGFSPEMEAEARGQCTPITTGMAFPGTAMFSR